MFMRVALCIALVVVTSNGANFRKRNYDTTPIEPHRPDRQNVTHMIQNAGYYVKEYQVETSDGYILDLIRIPNGIKKSVYENIEVSRKTDETSDEESYNSVSSDELNGENPIAPRSKGAILLMTGFLSNSEDFVIDGEYQGLAFILADFGFDVYLGNVRGGRYGLKHRTLDPKEGAFWRFGIHEIGTKDVPAIVDKVLEVSGESKIHYIGHMVGSTVFYVMTSTKPEYNDKIQSMIDLGNAVYMKNAYNKVIKKVSENLDHAGWIIQNLGEHKFTPSENLLRESEEACVQLHGEDSKLLPMCHSRFFLVSGYNSEKINKDSMLKLAHRTPSTTSTKQVLDLAIMKKTGLFGRCLATPGGLDECSVLEYNLQKVTAPVSVFYTFSDSLCPWSGVRKLLQNLPNAKDAILTGYHNNLELLHGKYVNYVVIPRIIAILVRK